MVEDLWCCGAISPPKALAVLISGDSIDRISDIMDSRKYQVILNQNLAAHARKLELGY